MLDRHQSIADLVLDHSECAVVFQRHRIDFCCGGKLSVEAAATAKQLDVEALVGELSLAIAERQGFPQVDLRELSTQRLVAHIIAKHHEYLRRALPFVRALAAKVSRVHGDHNPKLRDLATAVEELAAALLPHLDDEEQSLFPALTVEQPNREQVSKFLATMMEDHLTVAKILQSIRTASDDFTLPEWACNSYRALFSELKQMESDVFTHVHLENHILLPRFSS